MPAPGSQRASESADEFMGEPRDVTPGDFDTHPTSETFSVGDECTFSPDSRFLVFTAPPEHNEAWSTNYNICRVSIDGGDVKCLTDGFPAANGAPRFSPDGKQFAFRTQRRAGFESDKWDIVVVDTHRDGQWKRKPQNVTSRFDMSVSEFTWTMRKGVPGLIVVAEQNGHKLLFRQERKDRFAPHRSIDRGTIECLTASRDGRSLAFLYATMDHPADVFLLAKDGMVNVSHVNDDLLAQLSLEVPQSVTVHGTDSTPMQMWILKPPQFNGEQKWPLVYLVHGGPHVAWKDGWSYRWNAQLWAAQGYIVALPNPRGSTGFGQKFVDEITGDWGGRCYDDLMSGIAYLEQQPYIDSERMAAAGSSFGGYMMNWFQGHTAKFKTLVTHGGIYNLESMYATTDELWFSEWNHSGLPWSNPGSYAKFSPHRFTRKFKTPMMIIHNDLDFRVSVSEGLQLFTTLQRLGIPSKMLNFPDEGHWVQKPANSEFWHREVFAWLAQYVTPGGKARAGGPVS
jgi:dipeptidyl aminopeptidase/acylaminoacyl peptidase